MTRLLSMLAACASVCWAAADPALIRARDIQDRPALDHLVASARAAAEKSPQDAAALYRYALASSIAAEVALEVRDKPAGRHAAEAGMKAAEAAVQIDPKKGEYYRVLGTLCGQAVQDFLSALSYGKKAQDAIEKAKQLEPKAPSVWLADGVGKYYLPAQFGGGADAAILSLKHSLDLDPKYAEAWLWLGLAQRKKGANAEARAAFEKSLALDPNRIWAKQQLEKTPAK